MKYDPERCPGCRARMAPDPICPRCGCDFTLAWNAQAQAHSLLLRAVRSMADGDCEMANRLIEKSLFLRRGPMPEAIAEMLKVCGQSSTDLEE